MAFKLNIVKQREGGWALDWEGANEWLLFFNYALPGSSNNLR